MSVNAITRTDAEVLIPTGEVREIFKGVSEKSIAFQLMTRLPNMSSNKTNLKVLASLPLVYWQNGDTAKKKTTKVMWDKKVITAEELAVIVPIPEAVLDDADYDIWGEIRPKIEEAIAKKVDQAVLLGVDKPTSFPDGILTVATTRGYTVADDGTLSFYKLVSKAMGKVEQSGFDVTGILGGVALKQKFREMTDTTGQLITGSEVGALPRHFVKNGAWDESLAQFVVGDFKQGVYSIRQDITYKLLTEAVIQDPADDSIVYNLAQDDMVALRVVFRFGWQLPNPINALKPSEEARLPFAVVLPQSDSSESNESSESSDSEGQ